MSEYQNDSQRSDDFRFDIIEHIAVLGKRDNGWIKEVNLVSWNGLPAKIDVRDWEPNHERMSRGITLFEEEAKKLNKALSERYSFKKAKTVEPGSEPQPAAPAVPPPVPASASAAPA